MLSWSDNITTDPLLEPVTIAEAKRNCDLADADTSRDVDFKAWIKEARQKVEYDARVALITQSHTFQLDQWPAERLELPVWPLQSITSVKYQDTANAQQTLATSVYGSDTVRRPPLVYLLKDQQWPTLYGGHNDIEIIYVAGFGDGRADVPGAARSAMLMLIRHRFEQPDILELSAMTETPHGYATAIRNLRGGLYP